jgi:hypothetical protein
MSVVGIPGARLPSFIGGEQIDLELPALNKGQKESSLRSPVQF